MNRIILAALFLALTATSAQAVLIDDFEDQAITIAIVGITSPASTVTTLTTGASQPFDTRTDTVAISGATNAVAVSSSGFGAMNLANPATGNTLFTLAYQSIASGPANLLADGADAFVLTFAGADFPTGLSISVNGVSSSGNVFMTPSASFPADLEIPFSSFVGADFSSVSELELQFEASAGATNDVSIDSFETTIAASQPVPEPTSAALLGAGLLGWAMLRRRRDA